MASTKRTAETVQETPITEPEYTVEEFAENAISVFGAAPDIVTAALRVAGVTKTTKSAASKIIEEFRKKEVN